MRHDEIARRFNHAFGRAQRAVLVGGAEEPLYLPATASRPAVIRYTRDYARSALHEIAHWCVAGPQRRALVDYGYWYLPPPRTVTQQDRFEAAEVPVQALELLLSAVAGVRFHVSGDNPGSPCEDLPGLEHKVRAAALARLGRAPAPRTAAVMAALNHGWRAVLADLLEEIRVPLAVEASGTANPESEDSRKASACG